MIARHCVVQKNLHYYRSRINDGKCQFRPGDSVFIMKEEFPRLKAKGFVKAAEDEYCEVIASEAELRDWFPVTSKEIWVFGDGPTACSCRDKPSKDAVIFAVNRCMLPPLSLVPTYYNALDNEFFREDWQVSKGRPAADEVSALPAIRKYTKRGNHSADKLAWHDLRQYDVLGEIGFSDHLGEVYHGKTSAYIALQLAVQSVADHIGTPGNGGIEFHLAGVDLANIARPDGVVVSHHYGHGNFQEPLYFRMLEAFRYGLNWLNEKKIKWVNHSPLLAGRISDLGGEYGRSEF